MEEVYEEGGGMFFAQLNAKPRADPGLPFLRRSTTSNLTKMASGTLMKSTRLLAPQLHLSRTSTVLSISLVTSLLPSPSNQHPWPFNK